MPAARGCVPVGTLEVSAPVTLEELGDPEMNHDPTKVTDGIDLNDDPILEARRGVYEVSAAYRTGGWHACPFAKLYE
jgi:catalase